MKTVLVVGQTQPESSGQAVVISNILDGCYTNIKVVHCNFDFSNNVSAMGSFTPGKVFRLIRVVFRAIVLRVQCKPNILYYPVAGPHVVPILRDLVFLGCTRWMFKYTVFHFHAATTSQRVSRLPWPLRFLLLKVYNNADCAVLTAPENYPDGLRLGAKVTRILPNGIQDFASRYELIRSHRNEVRILFLSLVSEQKGIFVLLDACRRLKMEDAVFRLAVVGPYASPEFAKVVESFVSTAGLADSVEFLGELVARDKWSQYQMADIFCFPSHHPSESFGLVVVEAMQFALPVVASRWGGVQSVVEEGRTGLLFEPGNSAELASLLKALIGDGQLRSTLGTEGRKRYSQRFTAATFHGGFEKIIGMVTKPEEP